MERRMLRAAVIGVLALSAACAQNPESPVSPSAAASATDANPDGSKLKVSAPVLVAPEDGSRTDTIRPTVSFRNSSGKFTNVALSYRVQVFDTNGAAIAEILVPQDASGTTSLTAEADLAFDTEYRWRVRAEFQNEGGPWSSIYSFRTVQRVVIGSSNGSVGPPRSIFINEAQDIIMAIYAAARWDIGGRSSREQRNLYLDAAMAAIHYGHPKWNPKGPDSSWCIKNGGPGRPQADDVIALCGPRDAWDLVLSIGANNWSWHQEYIGKLPSVQFIYPPDPNAMRILP